VSQPTEQVVIVEEGREDVLVFGLDLMACKRSPGFLATLAADLQEVEETDIVDCMFESFLGLSLLARKSRLDDEARGGSAVEEELQLMIQDPRV
jgi:hypothetical protein